MALSAQAAIEYARKCFPHWRTDADDPLLIELVRRLDRARFARDQWEAKVAAIALEDPNRRSVPQRLTAAIDELNRAEQDRERFAHGGSARNDPPREKPEVVWRPDPDKLNAAIAWVRQVGHATARRGLVECLGLADDKAALSFLWPEGSTRDPASKGAFWPVLILAAYHARHGRPFTLGQVMERAQAREEAA